MEGVTRDYMRVVWEMLLKRLLLRCFDGSLASDDSVLLRCWVSGLITAHICAYMTLTRPKLSYNAVDELGFDRVNNEVRRPSNAMTVWKDSDPRLAAVLS